MHRILVGRGIRVGNFSMVPLSVLRRLVAVSELWNHYAAGAIKAKLPCVEIRTKRAKRLRGQAKMGFVGLITHGLSAFSVNGEVIGARLLLGASMLIILIFACMAIVFGIRLAPPYAIPGWTPYILGLLFIIFLQVIMASFFFTFITLNARNAVWFLPIRDYSYFILAAAEIPISRSARSAVSTENHESVSREVS